ncbi:hypothetical protein [Actinomyces stomatis]|uniref:hypothetical protein n=1 Tax=Actinomyces stomatis TaxID=3050227 RepID=UPI0028526D9C|nr:hypothetical protein [Actinomyces sp. PK606]
MEALDKKEGDIGYLVCESELNGVVAAASYCDDGDILVVGVTDPSGIVVADEAEPADVYAAALQIATKMEEIAVQRSRRAILIKSSAVCAGGMRGLVIPVSLAFDEAGYSQVSRSFYAIESVERTGVLAGVSSRVRSQISSASQIFVGRCVESEKDVAVVVQTYAEHSGQRGSRCPFTVDSLTQLSAPGIDLASARLYCSKEDASRVLGFSISVHDTISAEVFNWGSVDQEATAAHLTKFIIADTIQDLASQGYGVIEYGYRFDSPEHAELTEFYRCMGGRAVPGVWMHKEIAS